MERFAKLSRLWKVLLWRAARALAQEGRQSCSSALLLLLLLIFPSNWDDCNSWGKGERGAGLSRVAAAWCVTINYSWQGAAFPVLPGLAVSHWCCCLTWGLCSEQAPLLLCFGLGPSCRKTWRNSFPSDRANLGIAREHEFLSVWHTSLLWKPLATMLKSLMIQMS